MALDNIKGQLGGSKTPSAPKEKAPAPEPKKTPQDTSLWGGKQYLSGEKLRNWTRSNQAYNETKLPGKEIAERSQKLFGKEGDYLQIKDIDKKIKELNEQRSRTRPDLEVKEIEKDIKVAEVIRKAKQI